MKRLLLYLHDKKLREDRAKYLLEKLETYSGKLSNRQNNLEIFLIHQELYDLGLRV